MDALIFDTTFLIDFQRERAGGTGKAHKFLQAYAESLAFLPMTASGEFAEGFESLEDPIFLSVNGWIFPGPARQGHSVEAALEGRGPLRS